MLQKIIMFDMNFGIKNYKIYHNLMKQQQQPNGFSI